MEQRLAALHARVTSLWNIEIPEPGGLFQNEVTWRDRQPWLESCGYMLRPRYQLDWVPSWITSGKSWNRCEDGQEMISSHLMDATRLSDGAYVMLKPVRKSTHPYEAEIGQFLSSGALASDPRNHCVPIIEVLQPPGEGNLMLVMPMLRKYNDPAFETFDEVIDYFRQIFEGLLFMHEHNVAHRDCNGNNIMYDPTSLYPNSYHPIKSDKSRDLRGNARRYTRRQKPPKYYLVDFGISRQYASEDRPPSEPIIKGGDKSAPEHQEEYDSCDPFPTDVYYIGNMVRTDFLQVKGGFEFIEPLINDMVQRDPAKRPTMADVVSRFEKLSSSLSEWKLSSRVIDRNESVVMKFIRGVPHVGRQIGLLASKMVPSG